MLSISGMFSIITAIHNGLAMNKLYWKALSQNTNLPFELIIVDNHSTDGSENFFKELSERSTPEKKVIYIRNERNQTYPVSQNQGMAHASHDILCFFNNDIWIPKDWERPFVDALKANPLFVLSPSGQEAQPRQTLSDKLKRRSKHLTFFSFVWQKALGKTEEQRLWKILEWMYGDLEDFTPPTPTEGHCFFTGIKGDAVVFHKKLLEKLPGIWDERVQAADWHLFLMVAKLREKDPSVPLPQVFKRVYFHHFGRYSARMRWEPIPELKETLSIESIWGEETVRRLWWGYHLPA